MYQFVDFDRVHPMLYLLLIVLAAIIVAAIILAAVLRFGFTRPDRGRVVSLEEIFAERADESWVDLSQPPTQPIDIPEIRQ